MFWLLSVMVGVVLVEFTVRGFRNARLRAQMRVTGVTFRAFLAAETDDERERLAIAAGLRLLGFSLTCLVALAALALLALLPSWLLPWRRADDILYWMLVTLAAIGWWLLRLRDRRRHSASAAAGKGEATYSPAEQFLHQIALDPDRVRRTSFAMERFFCLPRRGPDRRLPCTERPVYVCGLARSGTTMLLRILARTGEFASLTYRDMPFVLAPNLWRWVTRWSSKSRKATERAHGDGILVDFESPEAFEEVFWRTFCTRTKGALGFGMSTPDERTLRAFVEFRALVVHRRDPAGKRATRYLSKNNNNLLRLESLCADPTATVLLAYRDPFDTALSLHRMHARFCQKHEQDPFVAEYMRWLSHYEFGPGHLPFCLARAKMQEGLRPDQPDYWLDYWNAVYEHVLLQESLGFTLVDHDALRTAPAQLIASLLRLLHTSGDVAELAVAIRPVTSNVAAQASFAPWLIEKAQAVHWALRRSRRNLSPERRDEA